VGFMGTAGGGIRWCISRRAWKLDAPILFNPGFYWVESFGWAWRRVVWLQTCFPI
jgi:hypothetical protein